MRGEAFITADEHPFKDAVDNIWGINIVRTKQDFAEAPDDVRVGFEITKQMPAFRCACCGQESHKPGGMVVLRVKPPVSHPNMTMIPLAICKKCTREPNAAKITERTFKTLTGAEKSSKHWKDIVH